MFAGVVTNGIFALRGADIVIVVLQTAQKLLINKNKEANMTNKVSLDKSKIKFVLLEGVHQSALDTLHAAGYTNIDFYKKALDGDELKEAIKDAHFIGLRSRTNLTKEMIEAAPKLNCHWLFLYWYQSSGS